MNLFEVAVIVPLHGSGSPRFCRPTGVLVRRLWNAVGGEGVVLLHAAGGGACGAHRHSSAHPNATGRGRREVAPPNGADAPRTRSREAELLADGGGSWGCVLRRLAGARLCIGLDRLRAWILPRCAGRERPTLAGVGG